MKMMEYMEDKFALKSQAMKASDYYMDQVMESLDSAQYFTKSPPKCVQAFGLQSGEHRSSPCGDQTREYAHFCKVKVIPQMCARVKRVKRERERGGGGESLHSPKSIFSMTFSFILLLINYNFFWIFILIF